MWGDEVSSLRFEVSPSPFLSRWAYAVYAMLLLAVASFIWRYFTDKKIFQQRLELERIKEQNMKELTLLHEHLPRPQNTAYAGH